MKHWGEWGLFGGAAVFYGALATQTVQGGDSGELTAVAASFGVAHPPGYPLFTLLGHAAAQIPAGTVAWRVALVSALAAAWTLFAIARGLRLASVSLPARAVAVAALAVAPTFVYLAGVAEVFTLHTAIAATLFWFAAMPSPATRPGLSALCLGLVIGLGGANHHTIVLAFPLALVAFANLLRVGSPKASVVALTAAGVLLGLLPYLTLVIAGGGANWPRWGETHTLDGFVRHFLRTDYGTLTLGLLKGTESAWDHVVAHLSRTLDVFGPALLFLAVIGAIRSIRGGDAPRASWLGRATLATWVLSGSILHAFFNNPIDRFGEEISARFDLLPFVTVVVLAALGLDAAQKLLSAARPGFRYVRHALVAALALIVAIQGALNLPSAIPRRHTLAESYGRDALALLPPRALLFIDGDRDYSVFTYLQSVAGTRPDVRVIHVPLLGHKWTIDELRRREPTLVLPFEPSRALSRPIMESAHGVGRRVFVTQSVATQMTRADRLVPFGVVVELLSPASPFPSPDELETKLLTILNRVALRPAQSVPPRASDADIPARYASGFLQLHSAFASLNDHAGVRRCNLALGALHTLFSNRDFK